MLEPVESPSMRTKQVAYTTAIHLMLNVLLLCVQLEKPDVLFYISILARIRYAQRRVLLPLLLSLSSPPQKYEHGKNNNGSNSKNRSYSNSCLRTRGQLEGVSS